LRNTADELMLMKT